MKRYGLSRKLCTTILPILCAGFLLTACKHSNVRQTQPTPPQVNCQSRAPSKSVPDVPGSLDQLQIWAAEMISIHMDDVTKRATTANCLDALRKAGTIR